MTSTDSHIVKSAVEAMLTSAVGGVIQQRAEISGIVWLEEPARRDAEGQLIPGEETNTLAVEELANRVVWCANSPGDGAVIIGIEENTARIIGTQLDPEWLCHCIAETVHITPASRVDVVNGLRVIVLEVTTADHLIPDTHGQLRWYVNGQLQSVTRAQWWQYRRDHGPFDPSVAASSKRAEDVGKGTHLIIARAAHDGEERPLIETLWNLGAIVAEESADSRVLTEAAAMLLTSNDQSLFEFTEITVPGGAAKKTISTKSHTSALEQLEEVLQLISFVTEVPAYPQEVRVTREFAIPPVAVREALLNALVHHDWHRPEPISIQWVSMDRALSVRSPGGFPTGIAEDTILTRQHTIRAALGDLLTALGYTTMTGRGIDTMYTEMLSRGLPQPVIQQLPGSYVECILHGDYVKEAMGDLVAALRPNEWRIDLRILLIVDYLVQHPWLCFDEVKRILQCPDDYAAHRAIHAARQAALADGPLLKPFGGGWILGDRARQHLQNTHHTLPYWRPSRNAVRQLVTFYLRFQPSITSTELCALGGISRVTAVKRLSEMVDAGDLVQKGNSRSTRYTLANGAS